MTPEVAARVYASTARPVERGGEAVLLALGGLGGAEVVDQLLQPAAEARGVGVGEPCARRRRRSCGRRRRWGASPRLRGGGRLRRRSGCPRRPRRCSRTGTDGRRGRRTSRSRRAPASSGRRARVRPSPAPSRGARPSLSAARASRRLRRRVRPVAEEQDNPRAEFVAERAKLVGLPHDEHVLGLVVGNGEAEGTRVVEAATVERATIPECTAFLVRSQEQFREQPGPGPGQDPASTTELSTKLSRGPSRPAVSVARSNRSPGWRQRTRTIRSHRRAPHSCPIATLPAPSQRLASNGLRAT